MATMNAQEWMEYLARQQRLVEDALAGKGREAQDAFQTLLKEWRQQVVDRDTEIEMLRADLSDLRANRRAIIAHAHSERAELYDTQDRLEQMGENERF